MTREADTPGRPSDVRLLLQRLEPHDREVILRYLEKIENPARCYLSLQGRELSASAPQRVVGLDAGSSAGSEALSPFSSCATRFEQLP